MADTIGAKVVLDGGKQFRNTLAEINAELKLNRSALKLAAAEADSAGDGIQSLQKHGVALNNALSDQTASIAKLSQLLGIAKERFGENSRQALDLATRLNNAKTEQVAFSRAAEDTSQKLRNASDSAGRFSSRIKNMLSAVSIWNILNIAIREVTNSIGAAVERYDTLNQMPRVMQQIGFDAETSQNSIDRLTEGIQGLPTALDDIVSSAQNIAVITGDLTLATETSLALNNAFLASGSAASDAARGLNQYTQLLSTGTVDMQSWRTLQETMGYALRETANAMGFAGDAATNDLYKALQSGKVTFKEFNSTLIELSTKTGGFADTAKKASVGIGTAVTNMRSAITRGVTAIIQVLDKNGNVGKAITSFGKGLELLLKTIGTIANIIVTVLAPAFGLLSDSIGVVIIALSSLTFGFIAYKATLIIIEFIHALAAGFTILESAMLASKFIMNLVTIAQTKLNVAMSANPIGIVVGAVAALVVGLIALHHWITGNTKAQNESNQAFSRAAKTITENLSTANLLAESGEAISEGYDSATDSLKDFANQIYDTYEDARKAAEDYNKTISNHGYQVVQDARGRAVVISRTNAKLYENMQPMIDKFYKGASDADKAYLARYLYEHKNELEELKRIYTSGGTDAGTAMVNGILKGISSKRNEVTRSVTTLTDDVKKEFERGLKINSPSKVTEEYGKYTIDGFVNAILAGRQTAQRAMASMLDSVKGEMDSVVATVIPAQPSGRLATAGAAGSASGNQTYGDYHDHRQLIVGNIDETNRMLRWWKDMQQNERKG